MQRVVFWCILLLLPWSKVATAYENPEDSLQVKKGLFSPDNRLKHLLISESIVYAGSMAALYTTWYRDYPQTSFRIFNDNSEWLQMDKVGHFSSAYALSSWNASLFRWAGSNQRSAAWSGAVSSLFFLTSVEVFDGFSAQWGFSPGDVIANSSGAALFLAQELAWKEQRMLMKFSYTSDPLSQRNPDVFGTAYSEHVLKDYNGQTYWLSCNLQSLSGSKRLPSWLNLAIGYGASGMTGADTGTDRLRQFYLAPDLYWSRIPVRKKWQRTLLKVLDVIKIPAPALEWNSSGRLQFHGLVF